MRSPLAVIALVACLAASARAEQVTRYEIHGELSVLTPPADFLESEPYDEEVVGDANINAQIIPPTTPVGEVSSGNWRLAPAGTLSWTGGTDLDCPYDPGSDAFSRPYVVLVGEEALDDKYRLGPWIGFDNGRDFYRTRLFETAVMDASTLTPCGTVVDPVDCLYLQNHCECASLVTINFVCEGTIDPMAPPCTASGIPIAYTSDSYPRDGTVTIRYNTPPLDSQPAQAQTTIVHSRPTRMLVRELEGTDPPYKVTMIVEVGQDRYRDTFRYEFEFDIASLTCGGECVLNVPLPCGDTLTCCQRNPSDECCDTDPTTNDGVCCDRPCCEEHPTDGCCDSDPGTIGVYCCGGPPPCCEEFPTDPCCFPGGTTGMCCPSVDLRGNWQFIGHEPEVVYSKPHRLPAVRLDRGHWENERLGQVLPSTLGGGAPYSTTRALSRFALSDLFPSPARPEPTPPGYEGNYRVAGFHLLHDNADPMLEGQPCGPLPGQTPCGLIQLTWSSSGAGDRIDPHYHTGRMLWDECVDDTLLDAITRPDDQLDWLYFPSGSPPWDLRRCSPPFFPPFFPLAATCVTDQDEAGLPVPILAPEAFYPFVMEPGRVQGTVYLSDGDIIDEATHPGILEHLDDRAWVLADNGFGTTISGSPTFLLGLGTENTTDPTCQNRTATPTSNVFSAIVGAAGNAFWWNNRDERAQVVSSFLETTTGTPCPTLPTTGRRFFDYRQVPAMLGNVSGLFNQYLRLRFQRLVTWPGRLDGNTFVYPRRGGLNVGHEVVAATTQTEDHCLCFGLLQFYLGSTNSDFVSTISYAFQPRVTGRKVSALGPDEPDIVLDDSYWGEVCPTNARIALVNVPLPPGEYQLTPDFVWVGGSGRTQSGTLTTCPIECGKISRLCDTNVPVCSTPTVPPGPVVLDATCRGVVPIEMRIFDCKESCNDVPPTSTVSVYACTADPAYAAEFPPADDAVCPAACPELVSRTPAPIDIGNEPPCGPSGNVTLDTTVIGTTGRGCGSTHFCLVVIDDEGLRNESCEIDVAYVDVTDPSLSIPPSVVQDCSVPRPPCDPALATASDECWLDSLTCVESGPTGACPEVYTHTYTATDACGNDTVLDRTITLTDTTRPVITSCPGDVTVDCTAPLPPCDPAAAVVTDDCHSWTVTCTRTGPVGSCPEVYTDTWVATDLCGNESLPCSRTVTVVDTTPPVVTCPPDIVQDCSVPVPPCSAALDPIDCHPVDVTCVQTGPVGACPEVYTQTFTATDSCGNETTCVRTIRLTDTTRPIIVSCPGNVTIDCKAPLPPCDPAAAVVTDDCHAWTVTCTRTGPVGTCPEVYTDTWLATDLCGNVSLPCSRTVSVVDTTPPIVTCPPDITQDCSVPVPPCSAALDPIDCHPVTVTCVQTGPVGECPEVYTQTFTATDTCLNSTTCVRTIRLTDTTPPVITSCPGDVTVECTDPLPPCDPAAAVVTDDCHDWTVTCTRTGPVGACPQVYTDTWVATDDCLNVSLPCTREVTATDTTPPIVTCPPPSIVQDCSVPVPPCDDPLTPIIDCHAVDVTCVQTGPAGTCPEVYTQTFTATDECLNSTTCVRTITLTDTTAPVLTCPATLILDCSDPVPPCDPAAATYVEDCHAVVQTCEQGPPTGDCPVVIIETYRAHDECLNEAIPCTRRIELRDTTPPVITSCPPDVTMNCDDPIPPCDPGAVTVTDDCHAWTVVCEQDPPTGVCPKIVVERWVATDACLNESLPCERQIILEDTTPPIVTVTDPVDETIMGGGGAPFCFPEPTIDVIEECGTWTLSLECSCECIPRSPPCDPYVCDPPGSCSVGGGFWCVTDDKCMPPGTRIWRLTAVVTDECDNTTSVPAGIVRVLHDASGSDCPLP